MEISVTKWPWKDIILGLIFIVVLYITLPYFGINSFSIVLALIGMVEWGTNLYFLGLYYTGELG
ncbi:hypothetical protein BN982_03721 [Halobacillus karajensis]|uniref:Uncharacterized protein n=1 Tax=Halobacillus karajensis TaxID=195088 RepID=A0A024P9P6_9BACI|nr:hypothetical protein BN982_03721 [Halobacillus karajensis]CDQ25578.1 hypothetical protein BN983_03930 [Halobacillus karajensis]CDQ25849.1 hypothetical protein BN981_00053 [Halobacillus karajensis]